MERELKERRETETRVREDRTAEGSLSPQQTPLCQCEHYQRRCCVKFPCCGVFYPCQHCHNLSGTCSADDRKAHDATHVKCGNCGLEEEVSMSCILGTYSYQSCLEEQNYENPVGWFIFVTQLKPENLTPMSSCLSHASTKIAPNIACDAMFS